MLLVAAMAAWKIALMALTSWVATTHGELQSWVPKSANLQLSPTSSSSVLPEASALMRELYATASTTVTMDPMRHIVPQLL